MTRMIMIKIMIITIEKEVTSATKMLISDFWKRNYKDFQAVFQSSEKYFLDFCGCQFQRFSFSINII